MPVESFLEILKKNRSELQAIFQSRGATLIAIDMSINNNALDISSPESLLKSCQQQMQDTGNQYYYGGYLEKRKLYRGSKAFEKRNIHLGIDIWSQPGTEIHSPLPGKVYGFADQNKPYDYGPVIILEHYFAGLKFYTLYGHLSRSSLQSIKRKMPIKAGQIIGKTGEFYENGNWPPHLHFQIIRDIADYRDDYPGVCAENELTFYQENCPNPAIFVEHPSLKPI